MVGEYLEPTRWIYSIPKLLSRTLLWTLSRATPGSFAHPRGAPIQRSMLLPRALGLHPESSGSPSQTNSPQHLQPLTLSSRPKRTGLFPPSYPSTPGHSPAIVSFHPDLVRMVPAAAACDRVRHGCAVPLGRHLLTPPPQSQRPRVPGARCGTRLPEPLPEPRMSAPLPVLHARGADLRVASPRQPEPRGSSHRPQLPPPLRPPGPSTPPSLGSSHLFGSKGPHSGGGWAQPRIQLEP